MEDESKKIIEEVHIKRRQTEKNKELQSDKIKNSLLNKKRFKEEKDNYVTAQKLLKNYREKQKSHSYNTKQKFMNNTRSKNFFDKTKENHVIIAVRIVG
jgi:hypothetical protein